MSWKELHGGVSPIFVKYHGTKYCANDLQFDQLRNFENVEISIGLLVNDQDYAMLDGGPSWNELGITELDDRTTLLAEVREATRSEGL